MTTKNNNLNIYPSKEEYLIKKHQIQETELHSERFATINQFLNDTYWNRQNIDIEEKLFSIVGSYGIEDNLINESNSKIKISRLKRYRELQKFLTSLDLKTIDSNIFLRTALQLIASSYSHCVAIYNELLIRMSKTAISDERTKRFEISCDIPRALEGFIPPKVQECVGIAYYRPQDYKISYIDILDKEHKYIYETYNKYADKIKKLAEDIYLLQMNLFTNSFPGELFNSHFIFYKPDKFTQMIVTFYLKPSDISIPQVLEEFENSWKNGTLNIKPSFTESEGDIEVGPILNKVNKG